MIKQKSMVEVVWCGWFVKGMHFSSKNARLLKITVQLVSSLKRFDLTKVDNRLIFVGGEAVEFKILKQETSRTSPNGECSLV